ncbi:hypothetical protein ACFWXK_10500 [Streptomyces sp. NPDC059070]|uniref:hypothetical protein n=1 Tax=Streptomyces sp. NPDC059070 TaxID=3346713 RepID=UPI0036D19787
MTFAPHLYRQLTRTRWRTAVTVVASLAFLSACSSTSHKATDTNSASTAPTSASATPAARPSSAPPDNAEKTAVLASYNAMWVQQMKAYRKADDKGTDLAKYAALNALSKFQLDLAHMRKAGTVGTGQVGHTPRVGTLDTTGKLPKATVTDCIDLSKWKAVRANGEPLPLPTNQPVRYVASASAERWNGRWMVTDYIPDGTRTC